MYVFNIYPGEFKSYEQEMSKTSYIGELRQKNWLMFRRELGNESPNITH